jgi:multiple sugar transport system substrate-binding protein
MRNEAGVYFIGGFIVSEFDDSIQEDLRVFPFPVLDTNFKQDAIDAPIDGFALGRRYEGATESSPAATELAKYLITKDAFEAYNKVNPGLISTNKNVHYDSIYCSVRGKKFLRVLEQEDSLLRNTPNIGCFIDRKMRSQGEIDAVLYGIHDFLRGKKPIDTICNTIQKKIDSMNSKKR